MEKNYNIEWCDLLITDILNPGSKDLFAMEDNQINAIISQIATEKEQLKSVLKNQVFGLTKESQIELLMRIKG